MKRIVAVVTVGFSLLSWSAVHTAGATAPAVASTTTVPIEVPPLATFQGSGAEVVDVGALIEGPHILDIAHTGDSNFIVEALDANLESYALLVNEIGAYQGRLLLNVRDGEATQYFQVDAGGAWTIEVRDLLAADLWGGGELHAVGSNVVLFNGDPGILEYAYTGEGNFVVFTYGESGSELLVNEIDAIEGTTVLRDSPAIVEVTADPAGEWWLNLRA